MQQFDLGLNLSTKKTRKREFLEQMQQVVPWKELVVLIAPYAPEGRKGRPPFPVEMLLRIHFMQQWFTAQEQDTDAGHAGIHQSHPQLFHKWPCDRPGCNTQSQNSDAVTTIILGYIKCLVCCCEDVLDINSGRPIQGM